MMSISPWTPTTVAGVSCLVESRGGNPRCGVRRPARGSGRGSREAGTQCTTDEAR